MNTFFRFPKGTAVSLVPSRQRYVSLEPLQKNQGSHFRLTAKSFVKVEVTRGPDVGRVATMITVKGPFGELGTALNRERGYMLAHRATAEGKSTQLTPAQAESVGWALGEFLRTSKLNQRELARMKKNPQEEFTRKPDSWYETPEGQLASLRSLHSMMKAAANGGWRK